MASGDLFGLDNFSYLSSPQQDTAKTIRDAFASSMAQRDRYLQRYPGLLPPSAPLASSFVNDEALRRAQVTAGILNNNQQLQNVIDASHVTPHGVVQNLAAYLPSVAAALRAFPALFGQQAGGELGRQGIIPYAYNKIAHAFKGPDGTTYALDENGKVIGSYDQSGKLVPWQGTPDQTGNVIPNYPTTGPVNYTGWPDAMGPPPPANTTYPQFTNDDYMSGGEADWGDYNGSGVSFGSEDFQIPFGM